jgi:two-component system, LytTR family, sensor kinase
MSDSPRAHAPFRPTPRTLTLAAVTLVAWGGVALVAAVQLYVYARVRGAPAPAGAFLRSMLALGFWAVFTPVLLWSARRFPIRRPRAVRNALLHAAAGALFILALNVFIETTARSVLEGRTDVAVGARMGAIAFVAVFHLAFIAYAFIVGLGHLGVVLDERREDELRAARLLAQLAEARLRALRQELDPHFLFNTLHAVAQLVRTGKKETALDVLERLGDLLRRSLAGRSEHEVTVDEEVAFARSYLAIEEVRFADRLRVSWRIAPDAEAALVPQLVLQPLVENALRHGVAVAARGGRVEIDVARDGDVLRLSVSDDGPGPPAAPAGGAGSGVGLSNTRERLLQLYGARQSLRLVPRPEGGTTAVVELPFHLASAAERVT